MTVNHSQSSILIDEAAAPVSSEPRSAGGAKRVLVVDDSALNVKLLCRLLEKRGWIVASAYSGAEAFRSVADASEGRFDLVFMDRNMPGMDGPETVRALRQIGFEGYIVGLTGDISAECVREFKVAGADSVVPKPLDVRKLESILAPFGTVPVPVQTPTTVDMTERTRHPTAAAMYVDPESDSALGIGKLI